MKTVALGLVVLLAAYFLYPFIQLGEIKRSSNERNDLLPDSVRPESYTIVLEPHWNNFTFSGTERIDVQILSSTTEITFHAYQLQILEASLHYPSTTVPVVLIPQKIIFNEEKKFVTLQFSSQLSVGTATLVLEFTGTINDQMSGFYRSQYKLPNGEVEYMLTTQMEPTDARRVFPCWDEPAIKATFELGFKIPAGISALSNMPPISAAMESKDKKLIKFDKTPKMSTYLVAFCLGKFEFLDNNADGTIVRVYTTPGKSEQGKFALQIATKSLEFYNEYFGIRYPLPKLDLIAIPDFAAGAMENWGLLTFRENLLLIDTTSSGISSRQKVAYVIAHEIAHQWFGNLVTMEWWKELWLNEGFATWVGNLAVDHIFPEWNIWLQFGTDYYAKAQSLDGLQSSHPIEVQVSSGDQIMEIFDAISYCKGASVIRTVEAFVGEKDFQQGMNLYLTRHAYGNAATEDLWNALSESSGKDVNKFMRNWTSVEGYPVVTISKTSGNTIQLKQQRFLSSPLATIDNQEAAQTWNIPLRIRTPSTVDEIIFSSKEETVSQTISQGIQSAEWIYANEKQIGFFRTLFADEGMRAKIRDNVMELDATERMGLQSDWFALSRANLMNISEALLLASKYIHEDKFAVWADLSDNLGNLLVLWEGEETFQELKEYCKKIFTTVLDRIGWENQPEDSDLQILLRTLMMRNVGLLGNEKMISIAQTKLSEHVKALNEGKTGLEADLQSVVFDIVIASGSDTEFHQLMDLYRSSESHEEKIRILKALSLAREESLIQSALTFSISESVRPQDTFYAFVSTSKSALGRRVAWEFLIVNWDTFVRKFGEGQFLFPRIISYATQFHTETEAAEVERFFQKNPVSFTRTLEQIHESILANAEWITLQRDNLNEFLGAQSQ